MTISSNTSSSTNKPLPHKSVTPGQHYSVIIVGAGQAGMSMSYHLAQSGIDHLLLERHDCVAYSWRKERWDAFCLVTPNWQCQLPGWNYEGKDPDGFMVKDEIVDYLQSYYDTYKPPVMFNSEVQSLTKDNNGVFFIETQAARFSADQVVIAAGSYHTPFILPYSEHFPDSVEQIHSRDYKNPDLLPEGEVMVIGTGQSGCQIAEDIHLSGRQVHLCVGPAPRVNRRYRGRDVVAWLEDMGYYETTLETHPDGANAVHSTNHYVTGRDGGRDLNLRIFAEQGMKLYGKLDGADSGVLKFEDDLEENLIYADDVAKRIREWIEAYIQENNIDAPEDDNIHSEFQPPTTDKLDLNSSNITSVIWATGFKPNYDWIRVDTFNENGHPTQERGVSPCDGLYFLGLNWMHTWGSGRFFHVGKDAEYLKDVIESRTANEPMMASS